MCWNLFFVNIKTILLQCKDSICNNGMFDDVGIVQDPESNSPERCVDIAVSSAEDPIKGHP